MQSPEGWPWMRMPFGKYRGIELRDLPDGYVTWLSTADLREPLLSAVLEEADARQPRRSWSGSHQPVKSGPAISFAVSDASLLRDVVERGYRAAAMIMHPDQGGSAEDMRRLNGLIGSLRSQLTGLGF